MRGNDKNRNKPLALDAMSLTSHGCCIRLKIPRASSGIFRRLQHPPIGFCIQHKAINKNKPFLRDNDESLESSVQFVQFVVLFTSFYPVVTQVIRSIRSIRGPFYPFLPRGLFFTVYTSSGKWGEVKWFISVYRLAEDGSLL